jgi:hypothetical protein
MVAKFTYPAAKKMKVTLMLCLWDRSVLSLQSRHRMGGSQRSALRDFPNVWSVVSNWRYRPIAAVHVHLRMLRCGPSNQPFVQSAAVCRRKRGSADETVKRLGR